MDFYLPGAAVYIECKRFHTPRACEQMSRVPDVIVVQGLEAARLLARLITGAAG